MAVTVTPYLITLDPQAAPYTAVDLWGAWRDWVLAGAGHKYLPALEQSGGAPLLGSDVQPLYLFLQNGDGWRLTSSDPTQWVVIDANLYGSDAGTTIYQPVAGVQPPIQIERSVKASAVAAGSGLSTAEHNALLALSNGLTEEQLTLLESLHKAQFNRRILDRVANELTLFETDGTTPFRRFDTNADMTEIVPKP